MKVIPSPSGGGFRACPELVEGVGVKSWQSHNQINHSSDNGPANFLTPITGAINMYSISYLSPPG